MKNIFNYIAFFILLSSNLMYTFNLGSCKDIVYLIEGGQQYSYGELVYQSGIALTLLFLFLSGRWGVKGWGHRLIYNCMVEIITICTWFTIVHNPYAMNWDEILFVQISISLMVLLYLICFLFPTFRRIII